MFKHGLQGNKETNRSILLKIQCIVVFIVLALFTLGCDDSQNTSAPPPENNKQVDVSSNKNASNKNETNKQDSNDNTEGVSAKDYLGTWNCERCTIVIEKDGDKYVANISWPKSSNETREWVYFCKYDKEKAILVCKGNGLCTDAMVYDNGKEVDVNVYDDGKCEFKMREGVLKWHDKKDNVAKNMVFKK